MEFSCCVITSTKPACVTKVFGIVDGELKKTTSASVSQGSMRVQRFSTPSEFANFLASLKPNQCLTYGVPPRDAGLVTESRWKELGEPADPLRRSHEVFAWPSTAGVMMLDYDAPKDGTPPLGRKELIKLVLDACPLLRDGCLIWWPSTSSHIFVEGADRTGLRGQRIYLFVTNASDIERAGRCLNERLWAMGHGRWEVSQSGQLLKRDLFDASVWQPNRIDFAAGAMCGPGISQKRGDPQVLGNSDEFLLDSAAAIPDLSAAEIERAREHQIQKKDSVQEEARRVRADWTRTRAKSLAEKSQSITVSRAVDVMKRAVEQGDLFGDFLLTVIGLDGNELEVTVLEVLQNPRKFDSLNTLDPLEPDYDGRRPVGKLFLFGGRPNLYSFAHGGANFRLHADPTRIQLIPGQTSKATDDLLNLLRASPDFYDFGADLVRVDSGGVLHSLGKSSLQYFAGGMTQFWTQKIKDGLPKEVLVDPPEKVCDAVVGLKEQRRLKRLTGVITAPTLRPDGSVLMNPGYDSQTGLLFEPFGQALAVPHSPTIDQAIRAVDDLWQPFADFPFCTPTDRAVHLAALLTCAVRSSIQTAPGFGYDAPVQGSGKTLLARCVGVLAQGSEPGVWPHAAGKDDDEIRKRLFTVLRSGARVLVWDNIVGTFDSAAMASCMTSPVLTDRVLGQSVSNSLPNRMLMLFTGNNLVLRGEMPRRILVCRIDPAMAEPFSREFPLEPYSFCLNNRQRLVGAALTLIRAYLTHGLKTQVNGSLASFEDWDSWVRRTVIFANELRPGMFGDLMDSIKLNQTVDPDMEALGNLLGAWEKLFGTKPISVASLLQAATPLVPTIDSSALRDSLEAITGADTHRLNARGVGKILGFRKGRIVEGRKIELGPKVDDKQTWRLHRTSA